MTRARFFAPARREFLLEIAYYTAIDPGAIAFPLAGSPGSANTRRIFVQEFPFALVYRPDEKGIVIFALAHHSRRPEYWQPRVQEP